MINQILSLIFMTLGGTAQGLAMEFMMEKKNEKTTPVIRLLHWIVLTLTGSYFNVFVSAIQETLYIRMLIHWTGVLSAVFLYYRQPLWQRLMAVILLFFAGGMAEIPTAIMLVNTNFDINIALDRTSQISALLIGWGAVIGSLSCMIVVVLWRKFFYHGRKMRYFGIILLGTASHWINFFVFMKFLWADDLTNGIIWSLLLEIICVISWILIVFSETEKEEMQRRLLETKRKTELEKSYYDDIKKRREEIASVNQKNTQEIINVKYLLKNNNPCEAETALRKLSTYLERMKDYKYCEIAVINAILSEKQKVCEENQILLEVDLQIPEESRIKQMDLCSVFGNLLDNAIRACKQVVLEKSDERVEIHLLAKVKGNYVIIKCDNPYAKEPSDVPEGSGYGLKILRDIAEKYNGDFKIEFAQQKFYASLILNYR